MNTHRICHITTVHPRYDVRIFEKECSSLSKAGYLVDLIVADGKGNQTINNIIIHDIGKPLSRKERVLKYPKLAFEKAKEINAELYHIHDPELMRLGINLKKIGAKVIFDAHEDLPKQILNKEYLNRFSRIVLSKLVAIYEKNVCKKFDAIITATPFIRDKFLEINKNTVDINNFPIIKELTNSVKWKDRKDEICYLGGISKTRGIKEIVKAMELVPNIILNLAGTFIEKEVEQEVKSYKGWQKVKELGFLGRKKVAEVLARSKSGLVTLHPTSNYIESYPVKMFEYMAAGLPVIASNFPLWKDIIETHNCGICVDPLNSKEIANAINYIISNPHKAEEMGENGRKIVESKLNWKTQEKKLIELYRKVLK